MLCTLCGAQIDAWKTNTYKLLRSMKIGRTRACLPILTSVAFTHPLPGSVRALPNLDGRPGQIGRPRISWPIRNWMWWGWYGSLFGCWSVCTLRPLTIIDSCWLFHESTFCLGNLKYPNVFCGSNEHTAMVIAGSLMLVLGTRAATWARYRHGLRRPWRMTCVSFFFCFHIS